MNIAACMMVRNMAWFMPAVVSSLRWLDRIYILDDHSTDATPLAARSAGGNQLIIERSPFANSAFEEGELKVRNYALERTFQLTGADAILLVDGDEVFSSQTQVSCCSCIRA